jgi:hypothetical protein
MVRYLVDVYRTDLKFNARIDVFLDFTRPYRNKNSKCVEGVLHSLINYYLTKVALYSADQYSIGKIIIVDHGNLPQGIYSAETYSHAFFNKEKYPVEYNNWLEKIYQELIDTEHAPVKTVNDFYLNSCNPIEQMAPKL